MLCSACNEICLQLDTATSSGILLQEYDSFLSLQSAASSCDLCSLFKNSMSWLRAPDIAPYCRTQWGEELWQRLLATSKISVFHVLHGAGNHNIELRGLLDAENTSHFVHGHGKYVLDTCLGGIYVAEDSPFSHLIHGRPATTLHDQKSAMDLLAAKYKICMQEHEECRARRTENFAPIRLLKIFKDKAVLTHTEGLSLEYATLSYCWGTSNTVRSTSDTLNLYSTQGLSLDKLPLTIRNAIELCIAVNIEYIWIDCLCILQDSAQDWVSNFSTMTTIYNSAVLGIRAAAGSESDHGLFKTRLSWNQKSIEIRCQTKGASQICSVREPLSHQDRGPADRRAWVLQEDLLSRRAAIFTPGQVLWQCCSSIWTESGIPLQQTPVANWLFPRPRLENPHYRESSVRSTGFSLPDWKYSRLWERIVREYCSRQMTVASDKLPALSGIADWISTHPSFDGKSRYFAGLWETHLPGCLLWYQQEVSPDYTEESRLPTTYTAPSWSWAAIDGEYLMWLDWRQHTMIAKVMKCSTQLQDSYEFGRVLGGSIELRTQVKRGSLIQQVNTRERFGFCDENTHLQAADLKQSGSDSALGETYFDTIEYNKAWLGFDAIPDHRSWTCECARISEEAGLLVEPVDIEHSGSSQTYRRIGIVHFFKPNASVWWKSSNELLIRLV